MVLINYSLFKELFRNVSVQNNTVIGTLKSKNKTGEDKLVTCQLYNDKTKKKSAKSRYYLFSLLLTAHIFVQ